MPPLAVGGGLALGGSIIGAIAAGKAASTQANAALQAAQLERQSAQEALAFQKQVFGTEQANIAPWLKAGQGAITSLSALAGGGLPGFTEQFHAPTGVTEQNDPGYQFRLSQGLQALQNSAAARGGLLSGGTAKDLENYAQNYASNEYGNVYGRALGEYQQRFNIFQTNQANQFNRLASVAGAGQIAAGQLNAAGQGAAGNVSNILLGSAGQIGGALQNAGAARASGYAGISNALSGGLGDIGQLLLLQKLGLFKGATGGGTGINYGPGAGG